MKARSRDIIQLKPHRSLQIMLPQSCCSYYHASPLFSPVDKRNIDKPIGFPFTYLVSTDVTYSYWTVLERMDVDTPGILTIFLWSLCMQVPSDQQSKLHFWLRTVTFYLINLRCFIEGGLLNFLIGFASISRMSLIGDGGVRTPDPCTLWPAPAPGLSRLD